MNDDLLRRVKAIDKRISLVWRRIRVPRGAEVRLLIAGQSLAVGIPRLPYASSLLSPSPLAFLTAEIFGLAFTLLGIVLLVSCYTGRLSWHGRVVALIGIALWATLMLAGSSPTSGLIALCSTCALIYEASSLGSEYHYH